MHGRTVDKCLAVVTCHAPVARAILDEQLDNVNETRLARSVDGADALARCLVVDVCDAAVLQDVSHHTNMALARCKLQHNN